MTGETTEVSRKKKLSPDHVEQVLSWIAHGYNAEMVADKIKEEFDIEVSRQNIHQNYVRGAKHAKRIKEIRKIIDEGLADHPLHSKAVRLEILMEAIKECLTWRTDKTIELSNGKIKIIQKKNVGIIPALIREARIEVEGVEQEGSGITPESTIIELLRKATEQGSDIERIRITQGSSPALKKFMANRSEDIFS